MRPVAPGRYRAAVDSPVTGAFAASAMVKGVSVARAALLSLVPRELRRRGDDLGALGRIADAGGGALLSPSASPPHPSGAPGGGAPPRGWPLLAAVAFFLLYVWKEGRAIR